ncbi:MAG: hypothetical protein N2Z23_09445 [Pyrinomonadaceae bacterium]|nr:hypothetical protein [Pyrinomonadaceae bacterium]
MNIGEADRMYVFSSVVLSSYLFPGYKALTETLGCCLIAKIFSERKFDAF